MGNSPAFLLPSRKPSKYCTWPSPAPWGPDPAVSLVEAPGSEVLVSPHVPHQIMTGSTEAARGLGEAMAWLVSGCSIRNASVKTRQSPRRHMCAPGRTLLVKVFACGLGRGKQAEGRWASESWATADRVTPSTGGGGLCCRLGPQSHCCCRPHC